MQIQSGNKQPSVRHTWRREYRNYTAINYGKWHMKRLFIRMNKLHSFADSLSRAA